MWRGRSPTIDLHFALVWCWWNTWQPETFFDSDWSIFKNVLYEITMQNNLKLCRNVLCEVFFTNDPSLVFIARHFSAEKQQHNIYWTAKETSQQITESHTFILKYNKHKINSFYIVWMVDLLSLGYEVISNVSIKQNHNILML